MIRILHLTDFHLNKRTLNDWNDFLSEAFFTKIDELQAVKKIDIVAFTGDLLDKGGISFGTATDGFNMFNLEIIQPILNRLSLDISSFIICPGNHDINRYADDEFVENGIKATLVNSEKIIDFISKRDSEATYHMLKRIEEYKEFEKNLYKDVIPNKTQSLFKFSIIKEINGQKIGISSLNSSWRCYGDEDYENIMIGENQLNDNFNYIKNCDIKIALLHHQLDWLSKFERKTISSHIIKEYDIILSGHVHENMSQFVTGFTGSSFLNVSPSGLNQIRTDSKEFSNGFTIIDYNDNVECHYLKYNHDQKKFVDDTDTVDTGKMTFKKPDNETQDDLRIYRKAINIIKEDYYKQMNAHFIKGKNMDDGQNVKNSFVFPPIDKWATISKDSVEKVSLNHIMNSPDHTLFLAPQENGKRSLLYRIIVEFVEDFEIFNKIPVFIDFAEIKNKELISIIKQYTMLSTVEIEYLLPKGKFVLLIDNLDFHEARNFEHQINRLHKFNSDFPLNRIIATYEHNNIDIIPPEIFNNSIIPFSLHYIRSLRVKEIKQIVQQWLPEEISTQNDSNLEKLVTTFTSYNLPNNALSVHLYLWSTEHSDRKPINQAVLMEIYIELILEKLREENIYSSSFDFTNKIQLISMIAEKMVKSEDGRLVLSEADYYKEVSEYIKLKVGFSFDVTVIAKYLLDRKIFVKNNSGEIKFAYICFMHFFVAKRMQDNSSFKDYILDENRYFNFPKEIDYYTGLVRSDIETFNKIYTRFKEVFDPMNFILEEVNPDEYFDIKTKGKNDSTEPIARNIEIARIKDSRPAESQIEKQYDEQLARISNVKIERDKSEKINFDRMMLIMCNVLRNSEGIEDLDLKKRAYNDIIKHNLTYSILYTQVLIRYIIENKALPPSVPPNISLEDLIKNTPVNMQYSLNVHLGTKKLDVVIANKISKDKIGESFTNSDIEKFLSVAIYSDIQGQNFDEYLRKFIKTVKTVPTQDYLLIKLVDYLFKRSNADSANELLYLDLISDLKIRSQKLPKRLKQEIMKNWKEKRDKMTKFIGMN